MLKAKRAGMALLDDIKKTVELATGWQRPSAAQLRAMPRRGKIGVFRFEDDGAVPNNPRWPVLILWHALRLPRSIDPAAAFEDLFKSNGWGASWRGSIYDYLHYHSRIHEVIGVARGSAKVRFGGEYGHTFKLSAGDVVILPAGTGHQCLSASKSFVAVGAYPSSGTYDECKPRTAAHARNAARVLKAVWPRKDPVFGRDGALFRYWV